jgi:hypothetical protein
MSPEFDGLTSMIATAAAAPIRPWWLGEEETTGDEMSPEVPKVSPHVDVDELTDLIATAYAAVVYEGVFDHHRPGRVIWPPTRGQP